MVLRNLSIFVLAYLAATAVVAMFKGQISPPSLIILSMGGLGIALGTLRRNLPSTNAQDTLPSGKAGANHPA